MNAGDRYFMAIVDLLGARDKLQRIIDGVKIDELPPSMELMSATIKDITDAMVKTQRDRLSDRRFDIAPICQAGDCDMSGDYRVCLNHVSDVEPR